MMCIMKNCKGNGWPVYVPHLSKPVGTGAVEIKPKAARVSVRVQRKMQRLCEKSPV